MAWISALKKKVRKKAQNAEDLNEKAHMPHSILLNAPGQARRSAFSELSTASSTSSSPDIDPMPTLRRRCITEPGGHLQPHPASEREVQVSFKPGTRDNDPSTKLNQTAVLLNPYQFELYLADLNELRMAKEAVAQSRPTIVRANERFARAYKAY